MGSLLPSALVLGAVALSALFLARTRPPPPRGSRAGRRAAQVFGVAVVAQGLHFAEEATTGFHERFPALFGLAAIPLPLFVGFNLAWLAIWIACLPGLRAGLRAALFAAWFLAIAGVLNGLAHPALAVAVRGYFPGLVSAPLIGVAGGALFRRLCRATRPAR